MPMKAELKIKLECATTVAVYDVVSPDEVCAAIHNHLHSVLARVLPCSISVEVGRGHYISPSDSLLESNIPINSAPGQLLIGNLNDPLLVKNPGSY